MEGNPITQLSPIDYLVMAVYFVAVLVVGMALRRAMRTSTDSSSPVGPFPRG